MFTDLVAIDGSNFGERNIGSETLQNVVVGEGGEGRIEKCTITRSMLDRRLLGRLRLLRQLAVVRLARTTIVCLRQSGCREHRCIV